MLHFFRRIRKGLIASSSTRKYLLYAVGEIALVVIGILIALQINNWNENHKKSVIELRMLRQVASDIENDTLLYNSGMVSLNMAIELIDNIQSEFAQDLPFNDSMSIKLAQVSLMGVSELKLAIYENLKSVGLEIIENDQLRNDIISYYEDKSAMNRTNEKYDSGIYFRENIYPEFFQSFAWGRRAIPKSYSALKVESKFLIALDYVDNDAHHYRGRLRRMKAKAKALHQNISEIISR